MICSRCNGTILKDYEDYTCIMCSRVFDEQGNELVPVMMSEKPRFNKVGYQER